MDVTTNLNKFYATLDSLNSLSEVHALLEWDQQVYMPSGGAEARARHLELVETLRHERMTSPEFLSLVGDLFAALEDLEYPDRVNVREVHRQVERQRKLPSEFVGRKSLACSRAFEAWTHARPLNDFGIARPALEEIIALAREEADLVGYEESPYDALLDAHEPGATLGLIKPTFVRLGGILVEMLPGIQRKFSNVPELEGEFSEAKQYAFSKEIIERLGFKFDEGRLDKSSHPFCTTIGSGDQRITTRYVHSSFIPALYGTIHEAGHALYEMGLPKQYHGTPMGTAVSLGLHESQSRFFENMIGRSREFTSFLHGRLSEYFPDFMRRVPPETLWAMVNKVEPSFIRVEADELSYSLHVIIRMLLEERLITGALTVKDLPGAWSDSYEEYLGIRPQSDSDGVLQDVHWYSGMVGYFPTYVLGNLYGALMLRSMEKAIPDYLRDVANGDFTRIGRWLRSHVHEKGMQHTGPELVKQISGEEVTEAPFVAYLAHKFGDPL